MEAAAGDPSPERNPAGRSVRINAVRRQDFGFVAVQWCDDLPAASGPIEVYAIPAVDLGRAIVGALPAVRATASAGDLLVDADAGARVGGSLFDENEVERPDHPIVSADCVSSGFLQVRDGRDVERLLDPALPRVVWGRLRRLWSLRGVRERVAVC
ncbi:hypothetical protein QSJ18_07220 [Gordonia sp. ABSL1-1]|uniref:hypothetical protein n=1 Tax=Gordonia sp. ABSL1-1 TaxID=3053923 RepID=UPI0025731200|nr:hypothetical protein [Gordonia sp. ABSL1-1]MDL9936528.1 hypothetical protein [Gordonia sp. ABSL1-1]